jgi:hypothetical protein
MLVDMKPLRCDGAKLLPAAVQASPAIRGELTIFTTRDDPMRAPGMPGATTCATLMKSLPDELPEYQGLSDVRITRMRGSEFVLVGSQRVGHPTLGHRIRQAWWCRVVSDAGAAAPHSNPVKVPEIADA